MVQGGGKDPSGLGESYSQGCSLSGCCYGNVLGSTYAQYIWMSTSAARRQGSLTSLGIGSPTHEDGMIKSYMLYACLVKVTLI